MKTVFVHDHIFKKLDGNYFSEGQLTCNTWQRYLKFSESVKVIGRYQNIDKHYSSKLNMSSCKGVEFHCFSNLGMKKRFFSNEISTIIRDIIKNADVVICRVPSFLGSKAFNIARKLNKRIILEVVGCPLDSYSTQGSLLGKLIAPIEYFKLKKILAKANYVIYVTEYFLQKRYPTRGLSTHASNVELIEHDYSINLEKDVKTVKFIGSLKAKYKGLIDLIHALKVLKDKGVELELHVLGSGDKAEYIRLINKLDVNVTFFEPIPEGYLIFKWLSDGDIYVQPSHTEGLPRALIEAMSVGLPCIGTNVGGIPELLTNEVLCDKKSPEQLADRIFRIINCPKNRVQQSKNNKAKSCEYLKNIISIRRDKLMSKVYSLNDL